MSRSMKREPIRDRDTVLAFGKYKGESIADVMEENPQYLVWLHNNSEYFELHADLLEECEEGADIERGKVFISRRSIEAATWKPEF